MSTTQSIHPTRTVTQCVETRQNIVQLAGQGRAGDTTEHLTPPSTDPLFGHGKQIRASVTSFIKNSQVQASDRTNIYLIFQLIFPVMSLSNKF